MTTIEWNSVRRVLVVRLRSIGDTVLATPSLVALKRFLPHAEVDILLEDWVAPLLDGFESVDNVFTVGRDTSSRMRTAWQLRRRGYDVAFNLHGGTTGTFFVAASGARRRIGFTEYQYSFLYSHLLTSASDFWQREHTHSVEQQLALLGFVGVPVNESERTHLDVTADAVRSIEEKFPVRPLRTQREFALIHPAAAFDTKQWATENFARIVEFLADKGIESVAIATKSERSVLENLQRESRVPITIFDDLLLPEITAMASKARLFVGNDSGIAHIAAAVNTPSVVVFGSSDPNHWRPWTDAPNEVVYHAMPCQPCPGYECKQFDRPHCILNVTAGSVISAVERVLSK